MPADTSLPEGVTLVDAFPFDSNPELITDVNGYLRGDRSVDAWTMQRVFRQFFSDGVFGTPSDALQIKKGASGLTVTIEPGMFVIQGGMGGVKESDGALTLTLDTGAAAGNVCYGIMLRYDNNPDMRGLGFRVVKGTAGASPQPPAPDQTSENVMEYRLGYVEVPNGATDLTNATVHNEKGLDVCPYAAPFEDIDMDAVVADAKAKAEESLDGFEGDLDGMRADAGESLTALQQYIADNEALIDSALDGTTAGHLQNQIDELESKPGVSNDSVDPSVFHVGKLTPDGNDRLQLNDNAITGDYIADGSVSTGKLADGTVTAEKISRSAIDMPGGVASAETVLDSIADFMSFAYEVNFAQLDSMDLDNIVSWKFQADVTMQSGNWSSSGSYYYVDGGAA